MKKPKFLQVRLENFAKRSKNLKRQSGLYHVFSNVCVKGCGKNFEILDIAEFTVGLIHHYFH